VLVSHEKRASYDRGLSEGKTRIDNRARESTAPRSLDDSITNPQSKKFFKLGIMNLGSKDWKGAVMNFNFARSFEPDSKIIADKLAEAQVGLKAHGAPPAKK
jgi:hypothetical protein